MSESKPTTNPNLPQSPKATETHPSPEVLPSGEELRNLQTRFDSVANSPFHERNGNPRFLTQVNPETSEVISRSVYTFGHHTGSTEYEIRGGEIAHIIRPDEIGAEPLSVDTSPDKQRDFMSSALYRIDEAQQKIDARQADQEAYAKKHYAPKLGRKILNSLGIKGPYLKQMQQYEEMRSKPTYRF